MRNSRFYLQLIAVFFIPISMLSAQNTRGFWLTNVDSRALFEKNGLEKVVNICEKYGFNTIYVVTWNRGYSLYPSEVMNRYFGRKIDPLLEGRDPLKELIALAKPKNIKVIAWFEFGFSSSYKEADGGELIRKKPHWAAIDGSGNLVSKNNFQWMNAFLPEVQQFMIELISEVVENYEVDGIQGDDRLPALPSTSGYDSYTLNMYKKEHNGALPPRDYKESNWVQWRADKLSDFMELLHGSLKKINPNLIISSSPSIYPWSKAEYLQDWPRWLSEGWVDEVIPQIYRYDVEKYAGELNKIVQNQVPKELLHKVVPGVLLKVHPYVAKDELLKSIIKTNRDAGFNGEVFFFYEGIKKRKAFFSTLYP